MPKPRTLYTLAVIACIGLMATALYFQHGLGLEPCPMCIFQRVAVISLGLICLVAALHGPARTGQRIYGLSELEFEALCCLYEHQGKVCRKDDLIENVYGQRYKDLKGGVTDEALHTLISRLRSKIEPDSSHPRYIVTVRGEGYKFVEHQEIETECESSTIALEE